MRISFQVVRCGEASGKVSEQACAARCAGAFPAGLRPSGAASQFRMPALCLAAAVLFLGGVAPGCSKDRGGLADEEGVGGACSLETCAGTCIEGVCVAGGAGSAGGSGGLGQPGVPPASVAPGFPSADCSEGFDGSLPTACQCAPDCLSSSFSGDGQGAFTSDDPFNDFDGVDVDPTTGELVLASTRTERAFIWIANTRQGTVSKIDTRSFDELGRYAMGPGSFINRETDADGRFRNQPNSDSRCDVFPFDFNDGGQSQPPRAPLETCEDPSRTSVNGAGDVFVGLRNAGAIVKVSAAGENCLDTNEDGTVSTSAGPWNVLEYGSDDCVQWRTPLFKGTDDTIRARHVRAVAAQDMVPLDATEVRSFVWVGDDDAGGTVWKVDGRTGEVVLTLRTPPSAPYGMALDGQGMLWLAGRRNRGLGSIDTRQCLADDQCPDEARANLPLPSAPYGITVDFKGRVWIGSDRYLIRYNPRTEHAGIARIRENEVRQCTSIGASLSGCNTEIAADADLSDWRWVLVDRQGRWGANFRGVTADASGGVFAAIEGAQSLAVNGDDPREHALRAGTNLSNNSWGMAVDLDGKVWVVGKDRAQPVVFDPAASGTIAEASSIDLTGPYTYSDMTGSQLRFATNPAGTLRRTFEGCSGSQNTIWQSLGFIASIPTGTSIQVRARTATSAAALADQEFITVATLQEGLSPASLIEAFTAAGINQLRFLELEVRLSSDSSDPTRFLTPRLRAFDVGYTCQVGSVLI